MLTDFQKKFYYGFLVVLILGFSPFKILAAIGPYIFLGIFLVSYQVKISLVRRLFYFFIFAVITFLFYKTIYLNSYISQNFFLTLLTYSSFIPIFAIRNNLINNHFLRDKIFRVIFFFFVLQAFIGLIQVGYGFTKTWSFAGSTGDHVEGTIHLMLDFSGTFSNVMYAILMSFLGLSLLVYKDLLRSKKKLALYLIGWLSIILASVIHVLIFLFAAAFISFFYIKPIFSDKINAINKKINHSRKYILSAVFILIIASAGFVGKNIALIDSYLEKFVTVSESFPKTAITIDVFESLPEDEPLQPIIGLGPGQFTSRASLMSTGLYLGTSINPQTPPFLEQKWHPLAKKYLKPKLLQSEELGAMFGSTKKPHYSLLSLYTEFGLVGFTVVFTLVGFFVFSIKKQKKLSKRINVVRFIIVTGVLFMIFLSLQENYWELTQSIFPGLLLMKLLYASIDDTENKKVILQKNGN